LNNKGNVLSDQEKYDEAIKYFDKAINSNSKLAYAWNYKGLALSGLGDYAKAIACCDKALEIDPNSKDTWNNKGHILITNGNYLEAEKCYRHVLNIDNKDISALKGLISLYSDYKYDYKKALKLKDLTSCC
jgi:tetratricopeptide (TPR) repeat protein